MHTFPVSSWSAISGQIRTGDVMLFSRPSDAGSRVLAEVTDSPYSHVAMLVRTTLDGPPQLWQEATQSPAGDPYHAGAAHPGAQLGDALEVLRVMTDDQFRMTPYYRPLQLTRDAAFEQQVVETIEAFDGIPFPSTAHMVEHGVEGRYLGIDSGKADMFCAQLVAATYQRIGLLGLEHPANWYNQASFGGLGKCADDCVFLRGASWGGPAVQIAVPLA